MHDFWNSLQHFIDPEKLLKEGGFYVVMFVIFAETGLFFGSFYPATICCSSQGCSSLQAN
jgi:membrane-associated protein